MDNGLFYKVPLRLIDVSDWRTSKLLWAVCWRTSTESGRYYITSITEDEASVAEYEFVKDFEDVETLVLYFCDKCGEPLDTFFCSCPGCLATYHSEIPGEIHEIVPVLKDNLPEAIIRAHNNKPCEGASFQNIYEWTAPNDAKRQPSFNYRR